MVDLNALRRFSTDELAIPPEEYPEAARFCREHAAGGGDERFVALATCFEISANLFGEGESGVAHAGAWGELIERWQAELPDVLTEADVAQALVLAQHLQEELRLLVLANPPP